MPASLCMEFGDDVSFVIPGGVIDKKLLSLSVAPRGQKIFNSDGWKKSLTGTVFDYYSQISVTVQG